MCAQKTTCPYGATIQHQRSHRAIRGRSGRRWRVRRRGRRANRGRRSLRAQVEGSWGAAGAAAEAAVAPGAGGGFCISRIRTGLSPGRSGRRWRVRCSTDAPDAWEVAPGAGGGFSVISRISMLSTGRSGRRWRVRRRMLSTLLLWRSLRAQVKGSTAKLTTIAITKVAPSAGGGFYQV